MKLSYANVASTLALVLALATTTAFAASKLPARSVGEFQLRPGAVTAEKIRKAAVTAPKIKAEAIKQGKIANGAITAQKLSLASVSNATLQNASVNGEKIAEETIGGEKILESTLSQVPSAQRAETAGQAESANPPAFAHITKEASIDQNLSKNISSAKAGSLAGIYCIGVAGFNPKGAQVSPQFNVSGQISAYVTIGGTAECASPGIEVQTFDAGARAKEAFYLSVYR